MAWQKKEVSNKCVYINHIYIYIYINNNSNNDDILYDLYNIYIYIYICISLSLYIYIYIYIYEDPRCHRESRTRPRRGRGARPGRTIVCSFVFFLPYFVYHSFRCFLFKVFHVSLYIYIYIYRLFICLILCVYYHF